MRNSTGSRTACTAIQTAAAAAIRPTVIPPASTDRTSNHTPAGRIKSTPVPSPGMYLLQRMLNNKCGNTTFSRTAHTKPA